MARRNAPRDRTAARRYHRSSLTPHCSHSANRRRNQKHQRLTPNPNPGPSLITTFALVALLSGFRFTADAFQLHVPFQKHGSPPPTAEHAKAKKTQRQEPIYQIVGEKEGVESDLSNKKIINLTLTAWDSDDFASLNTPGTIGSLLAQMKDDEQLIEQLHRHNGDSYADGSIEHHPERTHATHYARSNARHTNELRDQGAHSDDDRTVEDVLSGMYDADIHAHRIKKPSIFSFVDDGLAAPDVPTPQNLDYAMHVRDVAVSVASNAKDISEWKSFCRGFKDGGVMPLLDCIREGAESIARHNQLLDKKITSKKIVYEDELAAHEEALLAATNACRGLCNLCSLSPELSAVVTDGILRANAASIEDGSSQSLMSDMCALLRHSNDSKEFDVKLNKKAIKWAISNWRSRREARLQCRLYVSQLFLAMAISSDDAIDVLRGTDGLRESVLECSSFTSKEKTRRWLRYPGEVAKWVWRSKKRKWKKSVGKQRDTDSAEPENEQRRRRPFIEATALADNPSGHAQGTANKVLAALGYNQWIPKTPGQRGLRVLCLDGGGSRGMATVTAVDQIVKAAGGLEISDCFDMIVGTSTGAIISFLVGLRRETSSQAVDRYDQLVRKIFTKSALSTPMLLFTTATYDEAPFMDILKEILKDDSMLGSRHDPAVPYVCAVASKMSSTPTHVALFRNYNYAGGEPPDSFVVNPEEARVTLELPLGLEHKRIRSATYARKPAPKVGSPGVKLYDGGSRYPGTFRILQRHALRASTAAPTVFKPVVMGGEMYCDGGVVASNPTAIAIHEARNLFPDVPVELVVSVGTGGFLEKKNPNPKIGWDGIIGQIVNSATDGEQIHHLLEDILQGGTTRGRSSVSNTRYMRLNPVLGLPDAFPIDVTDPEKLQQLKQITLDYLEEPEQKEKVQAIVDVLRRRPRFG